MSGGLGPWGLDPDSAAPREGTHTGPWTPEAQEQRIISCQSNVFPALQTGVPGTGTPFQPRLPSPTSRSAHGYGAFVSGTWPLTSQDTNR